MDTERLCAKVRETFDQGPDAVVNLVVTLVGEVAAQVDGLAATVAGLQAANAMLRTERAALRACLRTDSHTGSKPPSSDGPGVKLHPKSQRLPTGRKTGGQPGHAGHTLELVDEPDEVTAHGPPCCPGCRRDRGDVPAVRRERRQIVDLPPVQARVVEHQVDTKCFPRCGAEASGAFPPDVAAPVQYGPGVATVAVYLNQEQLLPLERTSEVLANLFGCPIAEGTVERAVADCYDQLAGVEATIKQGVTEADVTHFNETCLDLRGKTAWLHVARTRQFTFYVAQAKRGRHAMDLIGVLSQFRGRAIHDGLVSS
jgi:transposase